jgi:hypothetical protein
MAVVGETYPKQQPMATEFPILMRVKNTVGTLSLRLLRRWTKESLGKTVVCLKAKAKRITGAIQKVAKSGDFWAVLRADTPGVSSMLKRTVNLGYYQSLRLA